MVLGLNGLKRLHQYEKPPKQRGQPGIDYPIAPNNFSASRGRPNGRPRTCAHGMVPAGAVAGEDAQGLAGETIPSSPPTLLPKLTPQTPTQAISSSEPWEHTYNKQHKNQPHLPHPPPPPPPQTHQSHQKRVHTNTQRKTNTADQSSASEDREADAFPLLLLPKMSRQDASSVGKGAEESGDHAVAAGAGMPVWTASGGGPGVGGDGVVDAWLAVLLWWLVVLI
ncbi:hypothetical protein G7Y79_00038g074450 [Physcia stellaris]|nr:hypothetical protein G7Y79_00038g074450 [Physcia stellaris]